MSNLQTYYHFKLDFQNTSNIFTFIKCFIAQFLKSHMHERLFLSLYLLV